MAMRSQSGASPGMVSPISSTGYWPTRDGAVLVMRISRHVNRVRFDDVRIDILKSLYESLIDPESRHDLGEYYTPDWLAARMVAATVDNPLEQRVMDPACGSGTFPFSSGAGRA